MEIFMECGICGNSYLQPKILPCFHTFCKHCLLQTAPSHSITLTCPQCTANSILPEKGVDQLTDNSFFIRLMEAQPPTKFSVTDDEATMDTSRFSNGDAPQDSQALHDVVDKIETQSSEIFHHNFQITPSPPLDNCHCPNGGTLEFLCTLCDRVVCEKCSQDAHIDHKSKLKSLNEAANDCETELVMQVNEIRQRVLYLQRCQTFLNETAQELSVNRDCAEMSVNEAFEKLENEIRRRKEEAFQMIELEFQIKRQILDRQRGDLSTALKNMTSAVNLVEMSVKQECKEMGDCNDSGIVQDSPEESESVSDDQNIFKTDNSSNIKTYLLHKHMSTRLSNLRDYGRSRLPEAITPIMNNPKQAAQCDTNNNETNLKELGSYFTKAFASPVDNPCLAWETSKEFSNLVDVASSVQCGSVVSDHIVAHSGTLTGSSLSNSATCNVGQEERIFLTTKDHLGNVERGVCGAVEATITSCKETNQTTSPNHIHSPEKSSTPVKEATAIEKCKIISNNPGSYEIVFTPNAKGNFLLTVKVHGQHVAKSPLMLRAEELPKVLQSVKDEKIRRVKNVRQKALKRPQSAGPIKSSIGDDLIVRFGVRGRGKGEFANPQDVATNNKGRYYVTDSNNQCIQVFELRNEGLTTKCLDRIGKRGRGIGQLQRPTGIVVFKNGDLIVSDYENKIVNVFSPSGVYKHRIGSGKLMGPRGVCLNNEGQLVIVDNKLCQIFIYQINGKLVTRFGTRGTGANQLAGPHYVAVNKRNEIFVTDFYNHSVKVFSESGAYLRSFGNKGEGCGQFNAPTGIAIDCKGNVVVADWGNSRIQIFDDEGSFLSYINVESEPLYGPQGVAASTKGYVAIADSGHQCVKVYKILH